MAQRNAQPLVSVIVPVYNVEKYLECCLDSIIGQTYQNLEIILVNDGSTDGSGEICLQYAQKDSRIRLFSQENRGLSAARNVGLDNMNGEYVVFVDSDDYMSLHFVEILLNKALEYDVPFAVCHTVIIEDRDDHAVWDTVPSGQENFCKKMTRDEVFDTIGTVDNSTFVVAFCKIYEKRIFEALRYPVGRKYEDEFVFSQIYAQVDDVCHINLRLYAHRKSLNSITRVNGVRRVHMKDAIDMWIDRLAFFMEYGVEKYCLRTEEQMFSELAIYLLDDDMPKGKKKQFIKETEARVYQITGKRYFSWRWTLFKISSEAYRFTRECYLWVRELKHKKLI